MCYGNQEHVTHAWRKNADVIKDFTIHKCTNEKTDKQTKLVKHTFRQTNKL